MILNLVILLVYVSNVFSDESAEGKYIDLLPEDEKREFLEKVARRILEEVESKDTVKKSGELSDDQLNKHSSYVSQVMKEEENVMMKKHENDTIVEKKDVRSKDSVVINQGKTETGGKIENGGGNGHLEYIDLTLRQGKASIREHETKMNSVTDTLDKPTPEESTSVATVNEEATKETVTPESTRQTETLHKDDNISIEITINANNTKKQLEANTQRLEPSNDINIPVQVFYDNIQNGYKESVQDNVKETTTRNLQTTTEEVKVDGGEYIYQSREENNNNDETRKTATVMENYEPKKCWSSEESSKTSTSLRTTTINKNLVTDPSQRVVTNCDGKPIKIETTSQWIIIDPPDVTGGIYEPIDMTRSKNTNDTDIDQKMIANGIITTTEASKVESDAVNTTSPVSDVVNSTQVDIPGNNTNAVKSKEKSATGVLVNTTNLYKDATTEVIFEIHKTTTEPSTIDISATIKPEVINQENIGNKSLNSEEPEKLAHKSTTFIFTTKTRFEEHKLQSSGLRLGDGEIQLENSQKNLVELESKYNEHKIKELKVFEIPPGQPLFVKSKPNIPKDFPKIGIPDIPEGPTENGEQPNYIPVYNYSPNNAYFNAYNRLGPNYEDEEANKNNDLINTNVLRIKSDSSISFESRERVNKKYYFFNSGPVLKKIRSKILLPPSMPKHKKKKFSTQIYLDDYTDTEETNYFRKEKMNKQYTRNRYKKEKKSKKLKERQSNEDSLQVDEMYARGTIKNHIDAVRNYLSKKNYFQFYDSPTALQEKKRDYKSRMWKNPKKAKTKKSDKNREVLNIPKEDLDRLKEDGKTIKEEGLDRLKEEGKTIKEEGLDRLKEEGKTIKEEGLDRIKEAADEAVGIEYNDNEKKDQNRLNNLKRLLRAKIATRYGKSKPNRRPKTETVDGFHKKPPKYGHGIDLDYYFGRTGPDKSSSSSAEHSFSSSEENSLEMDQLTIGKLGSIYYSNPHKNYDVYRRNKHSQKRVGNPGNDEIKSEDQSQKKQSSGDTKSKFTMADLNLVKNISAAVDLVPNVLMMQKLVGISERSGDDSKLKHYLTVLSDIIEIENQALLHYDWLGSAVDIQSALRKLIDLTEQLNDGDFDIHPSDWELFKYVFYIYKTVDEDVKENLQITRKMLHPDIPLERINEEDYFNDLEPLKLPRSNVKVGPKKLKKYGPYNTLKLPIPKLKTGPKKKKKYGPYSALKEEVLLYAEMLKEKKKLLKNILDLQEFLNLVLDNLNDLHDAIKHIGMVSKQKSVKWFKNLKEVYLNHPQKRELLTVLLHLSMNRVVNLLEESARDGAERSFVSYVKRERNALKIQRTKDEVSFVMSVLRELEKLEN